MDAILRGFEKCVASMTIKQASLPSISCERCACPTLPSTVRSPSAARSRTQRRATCSWFHRRTAAADSRCSVAQTDAGTETEHNNDCSTSARVPGTAPASKGADRLEPDAQGDGWARVAAEHTFTCTPPFHRALPPSSQAAHYGSSG
eukprot:5186406-Prymnesium_polylepis.2